MSGLLILNIQSDIIIVKYIKKNKFCYWQNIEPVMFQEHGFNYYRFRASKNGSLIHNIKLFRNLIKIILPQRKITILLLVATLI